MGSNSESIQHQTRQDNRLLAVLLLVSIAATLGTAWLFSSTQVHSSLFLLSNLIGPTTESLLHGKGLTVCTEAMGTLNNPICFHAARMPLPSLTVGLGIKFLGNRYLPVLLFKAILLLLPVEAAIYLVWLRMPRAPRSRLVATVLLLAPFTIAAFLASVVNLQVEEGYSYSFLALAVAILFFGIDRAASNRASRSLYLALLFAFSLDGLYLSKSSMLLVVAVLLIGYLFMERRTALRLLVFFLVAIAPVCWALHQHHASGRFSIGTSLDGINLHKGNNPAFLDHYPPPPGNTLDRFDPALNLGQTFSNEWSFDDYHQKAALTYIQTHPYNTISGDLRKLDVLLFSLRKIGSTDDQGTHGLIDIYGLLIFRLILWSAIACAFYSAFRHTPVNDPPLRAISGIFLAICAACLFPYVVGFAYTRHASILIYPAALMCCRMLIRNEGSESSPV